MAMTPRTARCRRLDVGTAPRTAAHGPSSSLPSPVAVAGRCWRGGGLDPAQEQRHGEIDGEATRFVTKSRIRPPSLNPIRAWAGPSESGAQDVVPDGWVYVEAAVRWRSKSVRALFTERRS